MEDTWEYDGKEGVEVPTDVTKVVVKDGVKEIPYEAFHGCHKIISVHIPESVEYIGTAAFVGCASLQNINLPSKIKTIEPLTFCGCKSLISLQLIHLPLTEIHSSAFMGCASLKTIHFPSTLSHIGNAAFVGCKSLTSIHLPPSIPNLHLAFEGCTSIKSIQFYSDENQRMYDGSDGGVILLAHVIKRHPDVARKPCTNDIVLPLHFTIMYFTQMHLWKERGKYFLTILKAAPEALSVRDPRYHMYPFLLAACTPEVTHGENRSQKVIDNHDHVNQIEFVYVLLCEAPWVMSFLLKSIEKES